MKPTKYFPDSLSDDEVALLIAVLQNEVTNDDPLFLLWLQKKEEHLHLYYYLQHQYEKDNSDRIKVLYKEKKDEIWQYIIRHSLAAPQKRRILWKPTVKLKYAAITIGFLAVCGIFILQMRNAIPMLEASTGDFTDSIFLRDGSLVILGKFSILKYPEHFNHQKKRNVSLSGEAFFKVAAEKIPFIVNTRHAFIEVKGTEFIVDAKDTAIQISATLLSGSIEFRKKSGQGKPFLLNPGEKLSQNVLQDTCFVEKISNPGTGYEWAFNEMYFDNASLATILDVLSKWNSLKINYVDPSVKEQRFSIKLYKNQPPEETFRLLEFTNKAIIRTRGKELFVSAP